MEALENVDIVAIASFVALAVAWVILPLRAPITSAAATPAVAPHETLETAAAA
jgi:hypothetical protein